MKFKVGDRVKLTFNNDFGTIVDEEEDCFGKHRQYKVLLDGDSDAIYYSKLSLELVDENNKTQDQQKLEELEQRIEKLEKEVFKPLTIKDGIKKSLEENLKTSLKPSLLTEDERFILRNLDKKWKWIARDEGGLLFIYDNKPEKHKPYWLPDGQQDVFSKFFPNIFKFIQWTDSEPYNIEELLKGECENEN